MYNIAIVEDENESVENLEECLGKYSKEANVDFHIKRFRNGAEFVLNYKAVFDLVFMDIDMPKMNGLEAAKKLREVDSEVILVFVTLLVKYAIRGYEFKAFDYMIKPVVYGLLKIRLDKILIEREKARKKDITLPLNNGFLRVDAFSLNYVEVSGHNVVYHTTNGDFATYGTMKDVERMLPSNLFCKCNRSYLVNLRNVFKIDNDYLVVGRDKLFIGRTRKKEFLDALQTYETEGDK